MSGGGGDAVIGFKYFFGIHMGVSRGPVDELVEIKVGDKSAWRGSVSTNTQFVIDKESLFGGTKGEGGIKGTFTTLFGGPTQVAHPDMAAVLHTPMPGFRRRFTCFFDGIVAMMNPYPKAWMFRVRRAVAGWDGDPWYPEKAIIPLIRPASSGETGNTEGTTETVTLTKTFSAIPNYTDALYGPWTLTVVPEGGPATIDRVYMQNYNGEGEYYHFILEEGVDYTIAGYEITLTRRGETDGFIPWIYTDRTVYVDYSYEITTVDPGTALGGVGEALIKAMNPVHIIYECLTNREWGRSLSAARLDEQSFRYAADQCAAEGFGMCIRWTRTEDIQSFIQTVLDHVGGTIFDDRLTGKIRIRLLRADYDRQQLTLYDSNNGLLGIRESSVPSLSGMINEVQVTYRDPVTNDDRTVRASNLGALQAAGGAVNKTTKTYAGLPTPQLALKLAHRDLKALSPAVRRFEITLDRRGHNVTPGSVFRIQDLNRSIADTVVRAVTIDYGKPGNGEIKVTALQDVFALPNRAFTTMGPPTWSKPTNRACVGMTHAFEMPYWAVYKQFNPADFAFIDENAAFLGVVSEEGQPLNSSYQIAVRSGLPEEGDQPADDSYICT